MADFEFEMELKGFRIRMKGKREDLPRAMDRLGNQMSGLLKGPKDFVEDAPPRKSVDSVQHEMFPALPPASKNGNGRRKPAKTQGGATVPPPEPLRWQHD